MQTMGQFLGHTPNGMGLATTAVLAALLDQLISRGVLDQPDVASVLDNALVSLRPHTNIVSVNDAVTIVSKLSRGFQQNV
jgi:hypothetical protein